MSGNLKTIREAIKKAVDDNLVGDGELLQASYKYDRSTLEGFPALVISRSDVSADYENTSADKRVYAFKLRVFYPITKESEHETVEEIMDDISDALEDLFSDNKVLGSACDWVEPAPNAPYYEERGEAIYRVVEVDLKCRKYVNKKVC